MKYPMKENANIYDCLIILLSRAWSYFLIFLLSKSFFFGGDCLGFFFFPVLYNYHLSEFRKAMEKPLIKAVLRSQTAVCNLDMAAGKELKFQKLCLPRRQQFRMSQQCEKLRHALSCYASK